MAPRKKSSLEKLALVFETLARLQVEGKFDIPTTGPACEITINIPTTGHPCKRVMKMIDELQEAVTKLNGKKRR